MRPPNAFKIVVLASRLSFPGTGPPDPGRVSEAFQKGSLKGSLKGFFEGVSEGSLKGLRRVLEGFWKGSSADPF